MTENKNPQGAIRDFASFAMDLEEGSDDGGHGRHAKYLLDANVLRFLEDPTPSEDLQMHGYSTQLMPAGVVASLVRRALSQPSGGTNRYAVTNSHFYEHQLAIIDHFNSNYDQARSAVERAFDQLTSGAAPETEADRIRHIVNGLKQFATEFAFLIEIVTRRAEQIQSFLKQIATVTPKPAELPELELTLDFIAFLLSEGDDRARFSVTRDIRALSDLAKENFAHPDHPTVLLTFDQKLLQACRLAKRLQLPGIDHMPTQNAQSVWIWAMDDIRKAGMAAGELRSLEQDFHTKSWQILSRVQPELAPQGAIQTSRSLDPFLFTKMDLPQRALKRFRELKNEPGFKDGLTALQDLMSELAAIVEASDRAVDDAEAEGSIARASDRFFKELRSLLPSLHLAVATNVEDQNILISKLLETGLSKENFLAALEKDIEAHAKSTLQILSASAFLAPKTLQAIRAFDESVEHQQHKVVPRVPLPIASDKFDVEHIVRMASRGSGHDAAYHSLLEAKNLSGPIADLVVAYLYSNAGLWSDAETLCQTAIAGEVRRQRETPELYELKLLNASILRISAIDDTRATQAAKLLQEAFTSQAPLPTADQKQFRVQLEQIALIVSLALRARYQINSIVVPYSQAEREELLALAPRLMKLKSEIRNDAQEGALRSKLLANLNIHVCLCHLLLQGHGASLPAELVTLYAEARSEFEVRLRAVDAGGTLRMSSFERVVGLNALLADLETGDSEARRKWFSDLRNVLGLMLQRRHLTNAYEYAFCRGVAANWQSIAADRVNVPVF